jgi:hypothetical protein
MGIMTALFGISPELLVLPLMYAGIGFLMAALIALAVSPAVYNRAERLTIRRLKRNVPKDEQQWRAREDRLRAHHATETQELERRLNRLRETAALRGADLGRRSAEANHLKLALAEKETALARLQDDDAERTIAALQAEIAGLTGAVESRTHLIDRQQHDIMTLTAQLDRIARTTVDMPEAALAPPVIASMSEPEARSAPQPIVEAALPAQAHLREGSAARPATTISFEARLAAIRDDKPLRDLRRPRHDTAPARRTVVIEPAPQAKPNPAQRAAETARVATDIRYDEPLSTADLLELGKAMLRQPAADGLPHRTH